jgi:Peroxidase
MQLVANIIVGKADGSSDEGNYNAPGPLGSGQCNKDLCCSWKYVAQELTAKFTGTGGRCTAYARGAIRLGFHDAATWKKGNTYGGADGSMLLTDEVTRAENAGLNETVTYLQSV